MRTIKKSPPVIELSAADKAAVKAKINKLKADVSAHYAHPVANTASPEKTCLWVIAGMLIGAMTLGIYLVITYG